MYYPDWDPSSTSGKVGAFPPIAFQTGKGHVFDGRLAAVLEWYYMVDLMREGSVILVQPTVLALV